MVYSQIGCHNEIDRKKSRDGGNGGQGGIRTPPHPQKTGRIEDTARQHSCLLLKNILCLDFFILKVPFMIAITSLMACLRLVEFFVKAGSLATFTSSCHGLK